MVEIEKYSNSLIEQNGIWYSSINGNVSYPSDGNKLCFDIEDQSFWFRNRNRVIWEGIKKFSIDGPIFDIGGGNGYVADYLSKKGVTTILIEPGIDGCFNAKERGLPYIINSLLDKVHFKENSIPNIGLFDVLEHIENPDKFISDLNKLMIVDGMLYLTVPAFNLLWSEEDIHAGHYKRYKIRELEYILDQHGFKTLYSTYFFSFLFLPVLMLRAIPSKFGIYNTDTKKSKRQHSSNEFTNRLFNLVMRFELRKIIKSKQIKYGSSILILAKKR